MLRKLTLFFLVLLSLTAQAWGQGREFGPHESPNNCPEPGVDHFHYRLPGSQPVWDPPITNIDDLANFIRQNPRNWRAMVENWGWSQSLIDKVLLNIQAGRVVPIPWAQVTERVQNDPALADYIIETEIPTCLVLRNNSRGPKDRTDRTAPAESTGQGMYDPTDGQPLKVYMFKVSELSYGLFIWLCFNPGDIDIGYISRTGREVVLELTVKKQVLNLTRGEIQYKTITEASVGDTGRYDIQIDIGGNATQNNVKLQDRLDSRLVFVPGSLRIDGVPIANEAALFSDARLNLGNLSPTIKHVTFDFRFAQSFRPEPGTTYGFINTAIVRSDELPERESAATVMLLLQATTTLSVQKDCQNFTKGSVFSKSTEITRGDVARCRIRLGTEGSNVTQTVNVRDFFSDMRFGNVVGTLQMDASPLRADMEAAFFTDAGLNIEMRPDAARTFLFKVEPKETFGPGTYEVVNNVIAKTMSMERRDSAKIMLKVETVGTIDTTGDTPVTHRRIWPWFIPPIVALASYAFLHGGAPASPACGGAKCPGIANNP